MGINLLQETHISFVSWQKGMGSPPVAVGNHPCYWENLLEMDTLWQFHITILWKNYHLLFSYIYKWATVHSYVVVDLKVYMDLFHWSSVWLLSCSCIHSPKNMMPNWSQYLMLDDVSNPSSENQPWKDGFSMIFLHFFRWSFLLPMGTMGKKMGIVQPLQGDVVHDQRRSLVDTWHCWHRRTMSGGATGRLSLWLQLW